MVKDLIFSQIIQATFISVVAAQFIKTILDWITHGEFHWQSLFRGAGMPSSHTATVTALTTSIYLTEGVTNLFIVALIFAIIVVRDVIGDKIFAVHQENLINKIIQQLSRHEKVEWTHLIGHSITEVVAGLTLGLGVTFLVFFYL